MKIRIAIKVVAEQKKLRHNAVVFKIYVVLVLYISIIARFLINVWKKLFARLLLKNGEIKPEILRHTYPLDSNPGVLFFKMGFGWALIKKIR